MKQFVLLIFALAILACNKNEKPIDVTGITPSPFIGYWEEASENDSIKNLSIRIGERNDSLLVAFYWESKRVSYITSEPFKDAKREIIPQACIAVPKSGNKAIGNIVNQYFSVYYLYPENEYYELVFELKSLDTLTFKIKGETNYWPDSASLVRRSNDNQQFSTKTVEIYKDNYNIAETEPTIFTGEWGWEKNGVWNDFDISIGERNDSLLIACGGVFYGGRKIQPIEYDDKDRIIPHARLAIPKSGNTARGTFANSCMDFFYDTDTCDYAISLELKSYNTLIFYDQVFLLLRNL